MSLIKNKHELILSFIYLSTAAFLILVDHLWLSSFVLSLVNNIFLICCACMGIVFFIDAFGTDSALADETNKKDHLHDHYLIQHNAESSTTIEVHIRWPSRPCGVNESHGVTVTCKKCNAALHSSS